MCVCTYFCIYVYDDIKTYCGVSSGLHEHCPALSAEERETRFLVNTEELRELGLAGETELDLSRVSVSVVSDSEVN